jgi:hypothetical protein
MRIKQTIIEYMDNISLKNIINKLSGSPVFKLKEFEIM